MSRSLLFLAALALQTTAPAVFGQTAPTASEAFEPPIVPVYEEPHHRQVFQYGHTRILDLRVPPNDGTWFHIHDSPVLYVTFSGTRMRTQVLGEENGGANGAGPRGRGAAGAGARGGALRAGAAAGGQGAARGGAGAGGRGGAAAGAARPAGPRATSTTSYFDHPITHRIDNVGTSLLQAMVVLNETAGDDTLSPEAAGFDGTPELTNKWFRSYRHTLQPGEVSAEHHHETPVVVIQATSGKGLAEGPMKFELNEKSQWAFFDAGVAHTLRNLGNTPLELLEIEVRQPR